MIKRYWKIFGIARKHLGKCGDYLRLLITGGSGFVGSNLIRHFSKRGYQVTSLERKSSNLWRLVGVEKINHNVVDLRSRSEVFEVIKYLRPDVVLHTASYGVYHFEKDMEKMFGTNLFGTMNLLDACIDNEVKLFINTGSCSEYGFEKRILKENDILNPETDYGISKALATQYCSYKSNSKTKTATLRLFTPYGYYEEKERLISYLIYCSIKREVARVSSLKNVRDFLFIEDVNRAYEKLVENRNKVRSGSVFNIGSGIQYSVGDVIRRFEGLKIKLVKAKRKKEKIRNFKADITAAENVFGWKPEVSLERGIWNTRKWMIENIELYERLSNDKSKSVTI